MTWEKWHFCAREVARREGGAILAPTHVVGPGPEAGGGGGGGLGWGGGGAGFLGMNPQRGERIEVLWNWKGDYFPKGDYVPNWGWLRLVVVASPLGPFRRLGVEVFFFFFFLDK